MIFLFPAESQHSFWMKNTPIPLDMIFINKDRKIIGIVEQAVPFSTDSRSVPGASQFVLEINGGFPSATESKPAIPSGSKLSRRKASSNKRIKRNARAGAL